MKNIKYFFLLLFIVAACNPSMSSTNTAAMVVGKPNDCNTISLPTGTRLVVELPCNPSTGYTWRVVQSDTSIVRETGECVFVPDDTAHPKGGAGTCSFPFETVGKGQTEIKMSYARWWEVPPAPVDSFRVTVVVH